MNTQPKKHTKLKRLFGGVGVVLLVLILGFLIIRPLYFNWGATAAEAADAMPGDLAGTRWTRAITIHATPKEIYPWLLQWGQGRGGWYSYDWLENLFGFDIHTADRILPEFQNPAPGEAMCMAAGFCPMNLTAVEPNRLIRWQAFDEHGAPTWTFILEITPVDDARSRLILRESFDPNWMPAPAMFALELPDAVMEQKALNTVKERAEGAAPYAWTTPLEIFVWLAALGMGIAAAVLFITRPDWKKPLAVGAASVIVLLIFTFLFLPLWLRVALDLALLAGLVWVYLDSGQTQRVARRERASQAAVR